MPEPILPFQEHSKQPNKLKIYLFFLAFILINTSIGYSCSKQSKITKEIISASTNYFIDSSNGNDANDGRSVNSPWQSSSKIGQVQLHPGRLCAVQEGIFIYRPVIYRKFRRKRELHRPN